MSGIAAGIAAGWLALAGPAAAGSATVAVASAGSTALATSAPGTTLTAEAVMAAVAAADAAMRDVTLRFEQTTTLKATAQSQALRGELTLLKSPERFRVQIVSPVNQLMIYDGKQLLLYFPETEQAFRQAASMNQLGKLLGLNPAAPSSLFREGYRAEVAGGGPGEVRLLLTPLPGSAGRLPAFAWRVTVDSRTWLMKEASHEDDEMRVSLACTGYRVNSGVSPNRFRFKLPPGTDVQDGLPNLFGGAGP